MSAWEKLKPTVVLTVITLIVSALLIVTYNLTYKDTSGVITEKLEKALSDALGGKDFRIVTDWENEGYKIAKPEDVQNLIVNSDGEVAFEIIGSGYSKDGLDLLVAMNADGTIRKINVISISETPGLGTKVNNSSFLAQYAGLDSFTVVKNKAENAGDIVAVTSATYSSKGVTKIANYACELFDKINGTEVSD